ncbi:MAG: response regulator [Candidatus Omnitrophica bacterium]|nr:response regulator [Candidatus Omnitrophota bacterium]
MKKRAVLVADDDQETCQLLNEYISGAMGCCVDVAFDGKMALEFLCSKTYDFVFLDCNMPELTGLEIAEYLQGQKRRPKIIMMTGYDQIDENFAKAVGVDIYLKKPILLDMVRKILL